VQDNIPTPNCNEEENGREDKKVWGGIVEKHPSSAFMPTHEILVKSEAKSTPASLTQQHSNGPAGFAIISKSFI